MIVKSINVSGEHTTETGTYNVNFNVFNGKVQGASASLMGENGDWLASVNKDSSNLNVNCATSHENLVEIVVRDFNEIWDEIQESEYVAAE